MENKYRGEKNAPSSGSVEAPVELVITLIVVEDGANDDAALLASVFEDGTSGVGKGAADDGDTELLVKVLGGDGLNTLVDR